MATWPVIIDDDGTGTTGTVVSAALFDLVKGYIASPWTTIPYAAANFCDSAGTPLGTSLIQKNVYCRIAAGTILWSFYANTLALPGASAGIHIRNLPFQFPDLFTVNPVSLASVPAYLEAITATQVAIKRLDLQAWAGGSHYAAFMAIVQVVEA